MRNPNWTEDEVILALDLYAKRRAIGRTWDGRTEGVRELSILLRDLPVHPVDLRTDAFRSPNSIALKLSNLGSLDPTYPSGTANGSKVDRAIWEAYKDDLDRLHKTAEAIRERYKEIPEIGMVGETGASYATRTDDQPHWIEGSILTRTHLLRERNPKAAAEKKRIELERTGRLECEPCTFDFYDTYGDHGRGYIECHHRVPLADLAGSRKTMLDDLALVCANCHRMLHRGRRLLSVEEVRGLVAG